MLKHPPLAAGLAVIREFGSDPQLFARLSFNRRPVLGHTGVDLAADPGAHAFAVQDGRVLRARRDADGFGGYVLLQHAWGQSLYARLDKLAVGEGRTVSAGAALGTVAPPTTGFPTHLHFGLRVLPYSLSDGWAGFVDPLPYLQRLTSPLGPIIGPHIIAGVRPHLPLLARWQPRLILVLDPNPQELRELRATCPSSVIVARLFHPYHEVDRRIRQDPRAAAEWAHEKTMAHFSPLVDYWQIANEVLQDRSGLVLLDEFERTRMALAERHGYKCAILAFSVGNPDLPESDRLAHWRKVYPALDYAEANGHIVAIHQYGMPTLWGPDNAYDWYIHRLEHQVLRRLPHKRLRFAVTEYGIDGLIRGGRPAGWQTFATPASYADQLIRAGRYLERFSDRVLGYAVFTLGHYMPWNTYDIAGEVAEQLAANLPRGVWADLGAESTGIAARATDSTAEPGPEALPPPPDTADNAPPATQPTRDRSNRKTTNPGPDPFHRRIAPAFGRFNCRIEAPDPLPGGSGDETVYVIKDIFFTTNGDWSADDSLTPPWAREAYRVANFLDSGSRHHLFAAVLDADGRFVANHAIRAWSDGFDRIFDPAYRGYSDTRTKEESGWANFPIGGGSAYAPSRGESGPWCFAPVHPTQPGPVALTEVMRGAGLPDNESVSTFVVWQAIPRRDWERYFGEPEEDGADPGENEPDAEEPHEPDGEEPDPDDDAGDKGAPGDPGDPNSGGDGSREPEPSKPTLKPARRISQWAAHYNMGFTNRLHAVARPARHAPDDLVFLIKDIFTTRNGSWEPDDRPGSVPPWARADYLRPLGAPDYFDDAGADHHLFAAVLGPDGRFVRGLPVVFWSQGLAALETPHAAQFVRRTTKSRSGWANIPIGPGSSFVPERGESGPWCWAPEGEAEVALGGGLPANHHISTFVVWQAVRRGDLWPDAENEVDDDDSGNERRDYSIYIPVIVR